MDVTLNGEAKTLDAGTTVAALLVALGVPGEHTAVELNGELLDRAEYGRGLEDDDRIEVVRFVGGG